MSGEKKTLNIDPIFRPAAAVQIRDFTVYLYSPTVATIQEFLSLPESLDAKAKFRVVLAKSASLEERKSWKEPLKPLSEEFIASLEDVELEELAERFVAKPTLLGIVEDDERPGAVFSRLPDETPFAFLARIVAEGARRQSELIERMRRDLNRSAADILAPLRARSAALSNVIGNMNSNLADITLQATATSQPPELTPHAALAHNAQSAAQIMQMAKHQSSERQKELNAAQQTSEMTKQSAELLQALADTAATFLGRFDERSKRADEDTRFSIKVAVFSVVVSAALAAGSLVYSALSYSRDEADGLAYGIWQKELLESHQQQVKAITLLAQETLRTRQELTEANRRMEAELLKARQELVELHAKQAADKEAGKQRPSGAPKLPKGA